MQREKQIEEIAREMCHLSAECKTCQICNERYHGDDYDLCYFKCVAKEIINHGFRKQIEAEWKQAYNSSPRYFCTHCNHLYNKSFKYCPNCGAKMKR